MFREVARKKQALSREECIEILKSEKRGVLSVITEDSYPYSMPMNHYYCEDDGYIYFHCGKKGHRTQCLELCNKASFCLTDKGTEKEGHWSLDFRSVIVFGRVYFCEDREKIASVCRLLSEKFTSDTDYIDNETSVFLKDTAMFYIVPENITGKRVNES